MSPVDTLTQWSSIKQCEANNQSVPDRVYDRVERFLDKYLNSGEIEQDEDGGFYLTKETK